MVAGAKSQKGQARLSERLGAAPDLAFLEPGVISEAAPR